MGILPWRIPTQVATRSTNPTDFRRSSGKLAPRCRTSRTRYDMHSIGAGPVTQSLPDLNQRRGSAVFDLPRLPPFPITGEPIDKRRALPPVGGVFACSSVTRQLPDDKLSTRLEGAALSLTNHPPRKEITCDRSGSRNQGVDASSCIDPYFHASDTWPRAKHPSLTFWHSSSRSGRQARCKPSRQQRIRVTNLRSSGHLTKPLPD